MEQPRAARAPHGALRARGRVLPARARTDESCCQAAFNLGSLHEDLGDLASAIAWYRRALEMEPDYADAHFNLAGVLAKTGRSESAAHHWRRYLELDPAVRGPRSRGRISRVDAEPGARRMKVLLVGGGGREHALAWKLAQSPQVIDGSSPLPAIRGSRAHATASTLKDTAVEELVALAAPRARSTSWWWGLSCRSPWASPTVSARPGSRSSARAGRRRGSRARRRSPRTSWRATASRPRASRTFTDAAAARPYCRELGAPLVVKADGLAAGKGAARVPHPRGGRRAVVLCLEERELRRRRTYHRDRGVHGGRGGLVLRARRTGRRRCPSAPRRITRPCSTTTGGPTRAAWARTRRPRCSTTRCEQRVMREIVAPTIERHAAGGRALPGRALRRAHDHADGPRVVEFNCRFGDPECQVILPRLDQDLLPLLVAVADGERLPPPSRWRAESSVCVVLASGGYPGAYETGLPDLRRRGGGSACRASTSSTRARRCAMASSSPRAGACSACRRSGTDIADARVAAPTPPWSGSASRARTAGRTSGAGPSRRR